MFLIKGKQTKKIKAHIFPFNKELVGRPHQVGTSIHENLFKTKF